MVPGEPDQAGEEDAAHTAEEDASQEQFNIPMLLKQRIVEVCSKSSFCIFSAGDTVLFFAHSSICHASVPALMNVTPACMRSQ